MSAIAAAGAARRNDPGAITAADSPRTIAEAVPVFLRHGSPRILLGAASVSLAVRVWLADWSWWDLVPVAALSAYWPIQEWLIHVYVLHFKPVTIGGRALDFRVPRKHREHHREPWKIDLLFIPMHTWLYSIPIVWPTG